MATVRAYGAVRPNDAFQPRDGSGFIVEVWFRQGAHGGNSLTHKIESASLFVKCIIPKKEPVVALVERGGELRAKHVADVTAKTLRHTLVTQASRKSHLRTDDSLAYYWLGREFASHRSVNHSAGEYVSRDGEAHVNTAESFFALLKRGVYGTFHSVSEAHLQKYVDEAAFKFNTRVSLGIDDAERTALAIQGASGKRLTYRPSDKA